ncbi:HAMP domain-containing histidine kinase [Cereibacter sphaeroides]|uniref:sensor histidine kinase n=1 Tax=Cereibacter sphaeroides TaxID=1063 RepID=UPI001F2D14EF|nr:HAMP domain-containing sensor histidine kinase [Cereibacter sphaeroides]MCE6960621.1 HAMP domain-containing histidine kinase [Cereibacter sphaeroides]MCE6970112.1 HAMP domain-containing histidine kinase [Cereibacter sphaeroides]MCE6973277.1 HAMP domain-containing histidine kinase [Cereibacter sphaeroides]
MTEALATRVLRSSSLRLAARLALIFIVATLLAGLVSVPLLTGALKERLRADARQMAESLAATWQVAGLVDLHAQIATNIATTRDFANLYLFIDNSGRIVFGNFNVPRPFTGPRELVSGRDMILPGRNAPEGLGFSAYGLRIPAGFVITARQTSALDEVQAIVRRSVASGLALAILLAVGVAGFLALRAERRIARLSDVLTRAAGGDLSQRVRDGGTDDIGRIAEAVNATLDQLELTVESLRQVSSDVAHDLRTPITRLRTSLEPLMLREDLPEDALGQIGSAVAQADRIVRIFNAVLRIAQIEGGGARPRFASLDLDQLASDLHEMLEPVAEELGHHLSVEAGPVTVQGDRDLLAQAIANLVENAFRHCSPPARIALAVRREGAEAVLTVTDNGPGIPEAERAAVFRRFYRLERSRNTEGSGLGLSLVAAVLRLHGGRVELADAEPGLRVTLHLPVSAG